MRVSCLCLVALGITNCASAQTPLDHDTSRGDALVAEYFHGQTEKITAATFSEIKSLEDWTRRREEYRRQLLEMLGLDPFPEHTPLNSVVTGTTEHDDFVVERLHFQSMPQLYVTANLYRPKQQTEPLPAILYVCGHGGVKKDGVSFGNKVHYQHHGAWFARSGYVCLTIDTIQLGEIEGIHHGTYREKMWWWNNRGYTPAGVEAWNCVRALDYLQSRDEVDGDRIGVTGRSGGGAYSWWIAAIDSRIKAAVPVAGITSLKNHVVDGCVEGHCDCMYMVNTYQWDYPMVAALVAPRPLLISNTDKDGIFPLDGVVDVHAKVRKIYELYDAGDKLGLNITEGPHEDTQELRMHAFRWLNRFLRQDEALITTQAVKFFEPKQLKVFEELPTDQRVTDIHETFVPSAPHEFPLDTEADLEAAIQRWMTQLREHCFRGWPDEAEDLAIEVVEEIDGEVKIRAVEFSSQNPYRLRLYLIQRSTQVGKPVSVSVMNQDDWESWAPAMATVLPDHFPGISPDPAKWDELMRQSHSNNTIFVAPRGVGPTQWSTDERKRTHIRRRFMQLGQTAASMQIYDVRRALQAIEKMEDLPSRRIELHARGEAAVWALYASLFEDRIDKLTLIELPNRNRDAPDILNVSRFVELPQIVRMAAQRVDELVVNPNE